MARPLENGDVALCFFNKRGGDKRASFDLKALSRDPYFNLSAPQIFSARELWNGDTLSGDTITVTVPRHGVKVFRVCTKAGA